MQDMPFRSASELVRDIESGRVSSRELLELYLARVDRFNPSINAIIVQQRDHARARADAADAARARGESWGPLHGLPMTVKESFNIKGLPTTWGHAAMSGNLAAEDALCIQRLTAAGAIVFGKTNVPVDLADFQSYNEVYGITGNPWDLTRTPGGSSGGSAAALAAGLTGLEMGSDIGGSIRNPAHFCGVFGHKPSWNVIPMRGHSLRNARTPTDISVLGPLARSAADLELVMRLVAEPEPLDAAGVSFNFPPLSKPVSALRVGVWATDPQCPSSADVRARVESVARVLSAAGAQVDGSARPAFDVVRSHAVYVSLLHGTMAARMPKAAYDKLVAQANALAADDNSELARVLRAQTLRLNDWAPLNEARAGLRWAWHDFFKDFDFMITPIMPTSAFPHDHGNFGGRKIQIDGKPFAYFDQTFWAGMVGVAMLPATIIPTGPDANGLPIGVQIIGPMMGDLQTIQLAQFLERQGFAFQPPPGLPA